MKTSFVFNKLNIFSLVVFQVAIFDFKFSRFIKTQLLDQGIQKIKDLSILYENDEIIDRRNRMNIFRVNRTDNLNTTNDPGTKYQIPNILSLTKKI